MRLLSVFLLLLIFSLNTNANVLVADDISSWKVNGEAELFVDRTGHKDVLEIQRQENWQNSQFKVPNLGFVDGVVWARIPIIQISQNETDDLYFVLDFPTLYEATLFYVKGREIEHLGSQGMFVDDEERVTTKFLFKLNRQEYIGGHFYLRIYADSAVQLPVSVEPYQQILKKSNRFHAFILFFCGGVVILAISNIGWYFFTRDMTHVYYALYIMSTGTIVCQLNGVGRLFLWSSNYINTVMTTLSATLMVIFASKFIESLFSTTILRVHRIMIHIIIAAALVLLLTSLLLEKDFSQQCTFLVAVFSVVVLIIIGNELRSNSPLAYYFMAAWSLFVFGLLVYTLNLFAILPSVDAVVHLKEIGAFFEMAAVSVLIGIKLLYSNRELIQVREKALNEEKEKNIALQENQRYAFLTRMANHELRQLFQNMLLKTESSLKESQTKGSIEELVNRAEQISEDTLRCERFLEGVSDQEVIVVDSVIADTIAMYSIKAKERDICIDYQFEPKDDTRIVFCASVLRVIVSNLLGNALKYAKSHIRVRVCSDVIIEGKAVLTILVEDDGPGMVGVDNPFETWISGESSGSTGLGLSMVNALVNKAKGSIDLTSQANKGCQFVLSIPVEFTSQLHCPEINESSKVGALRGKVLAVDDNSDCLEAYELYLKGSGVTLLTSKDSSEALASVGSFRPDLVLVDYEMPSINGAQLAEKIKGVNDIPVICLTGLEKNDVEHADLFTDIIRKPLRKTALLALLRQYLGNATTTIDCGPEDGSEETIGIYTSNHLLMALGESAEGNVSLLNLWIDSATDYYRQILEPHEGIAVRRPVLHEAYTVTEYLNYSELSQTISRLLKSTKKGEAIELDEHSLKKLRALILPALEVFRTYQEREQSA